MYKLTFLPVLKVFVVLVLTNCSLSQGADVSVGVIVPVADQLSLDHLDHSAWDSLLTKYCDARGMVNYAAWKSSAADSQTLDRYLDHLSYSNGKGTKDQQLAFWINTYNALTIKGILREYPTSSIRNHTAKLVGYNIWKNLKLTVGGKPISLDGIEHQVLRKMEEPRIHFAIVCASMGCPRLLNQAYSAEKLDEQLTSNAKSFFSDPDKFRYDSSRRIFHLSPILDWFGEDFGSSPSAQLRKISPWLPDPISSRAAASGAGTIAFLDYDWGLNERK